MRKLLFLPAVLIFGLASCSTRNVSVQQSSQAEEGVVINGVRWATRNVDAPGTFAATPESAGMLFQWSRRQGWNATDEAIPSDWDSTLPAAGTEWTRANDPCPQGWRMPTETELHSLNNAGSVWTSRNGVNGRVFGTYPYQIFLPASGGRNRTGALIFVGVYGGYWSSTQLGSAPAVALGLGSIGVGVGNDWQQFGGGLALLVRCVAI